MQTAEVHPRGCQCTKMPVASEHAQGKVSRSLQELYLINTKPEPLVTAASHSIAPSMPVFQP